MTSARSAAAADLKSYIERIERIAVDRKELGDDQRAIFAEAKAAGFDTKVMRRIIKTRDMDPAERAEGDSCLRLICMRSVSPSNRRCIPRSRPWVSMRAGATTSSPRCSCWSRTTASSLRKSAASRCASGAMPKARRTLPNISNRRRRRRKRPAAG